MRPFTWAPGEKDPRGADSEAGPGTSFKPADELHPDTPEKAEALSQF